MKLPFLKPSLLNLLLLVFFASIVRASHFRGGYISWQAVQPNDTNSSTVTIEFQQTLWWAYTRYPCSGSIGDATALICLTTSCSNYQSNAINMVTPCVNYDTGLDVSTGQSITSLTLQVAPRFVLGYSSSAWLALVSGSNALYGLATLIDLNRRNDTGRINSSPSSSMTPLVTVLPNVQQKLRIPMSDVDSDVVKCRWANATNIIGSTVINECRGVCRNFPNADLYSTSNLDNNCTLVFTAPFIGYYVIALQIEDFMPSSPNSSALSSIPLQFLVWAINTTCNQSNIIGPLANGDTIMVQANQTFFTTIIAEAGCNTTAINRFSTIITPSNDVNISTPISLGSMLYSINFTWTPTDDQIGSTLLYCTLAVDTNNLESPQYCLNFVVISSTPPPNTSTRTTNTPSVQDRTKELPWLLGIGIPLALLSAVLCSCLCCNLQKFPCWESLRQCYRNKNNTSDQINTNSEINKSSLDDNENRYGRSRQYREQYINERSSASTTRSSYVDSLFFESVSPTRSGFVRSSRISYLPSHSGSFLTNVGRPNASASGRLEPIQSGSILVHNFLEQNRQQHYV